MDQYVFLTILASLVFSAFFSGLEIAFVSSNKLKIELEKKSGFLPARIISYFVKNESLFISTLLLGNNIALVIYGIMMAMILEPVIGEWISSEPTILLLQTIISTLIILVTAEFLPKTVFRINPNWWLNILAIPVLLICGPLYLVVYVAISVPTSMLKLLFNIQLKRSEVSFGKVDLDHYLREVTSGVEEDSELEPEIQIFQNALDFSNVKARECMVPRTEIIALEVEDPIEELRERFVETGLSKILIYRDNIDNIIGYTHSSELFKKPEFIKNILLPISIVPETMPANEILELFIKQRRSLAIVVDEYGGTSGMVTVEDIIEEIFGEIEDEHDHEEYHEKQIGDNDFEFSARLEIDYLNEKYKLKLQESEDYETLAGLIIHVHEDIPEVDTRIPLPPYICEILKVEDNRIDLVRLKSEEGLF